MKILNVNCKHANGYGFCNKKKKVFFGIFKPSCREATELFHNCEVADRYERPNIPAKPPIKTLNDEYILDPSYTKVDGKRIYDHIALIKK